MSKGAQKKVSAADPGTADQTDTDRRPRRLPPYNVVILNDEEHSFPYVTEILVKLFGHPKTTADLLTWRIHLRGRAVVYTTHKEKAEFKREQVLAYGADPLSENSQGPLQCFIEPANTD
jgi:ATP-dependent Clp protease adaptor protein ClpS